MSFANCAQIEIEGEERKTTRAIDSKTNDVRNGRFACVFALLLACPAAALANGGPFILKYPGGDPAAKGVLARLDPSLKPAAETRLQVVKEELEIVFDSHSMWGVTVETNSPPRTLVTAKYYIKNPTPEHVEVDFGFPVLRGMYISPMSMMPRPDAQVTLESAGSKTNLPVDIISNSAIYGLIRSRTREAIESSVTSNQKLNERVGAVRFRIMLHSGLNYHVKQLRRAHPEVDMILIEPKPEDYQMFFYNIMRYSTQLIVARHGFESVTSI